GARGPGPGTGRRPTRRPRGSHAGPDRSAGTADIATRRQRADVAPSRGALLEVPELAPSAEPLARPLELLAPALLDPARELLDAALRLGPVRFDGRDDLLGTGGADPRPRMQRRRRPRLLAEGARPQLVQWRVGGELFPQLAPAADVGAGAHQRAISSSGCAIRAGCAGGSASWPSTSRTIHSRRTIASQYGHRAGLSGQTSVA